MIAAQICELDDVQTHRERDDERERCCETDYVTMQTPADGDSYMF